MILTNLSVDASEFHRATGWKIKPEGACKGHVCVPVLENVWGPDGQLDVPSVADRLGMALVRDDSADVWSLGPESLVRGPALPTAEAPELELPDLDGNLFRLVSLRGQKGVVAAWASGCGCREDLGLWQAFRAELQGDGLEIVTVAMDAGGAAAARPWIEKAKPTHPALIDSAHVLGARFGVVNVPNAFWVDEAGLIVRPPEPAWMEDPHASSETVTPPAAEMPPDPRP